MGHKFPAKLSGSASCCSVWLPPTSSSMAELSWKLSFTTYLIHALDSCVPKAVWLSGARWEHCSFPFGLLFYRTLPSRTAGSSFCSPFFTLCCSSSTSDMGLTGNEWIWQRVPYWINLMMLYLIKAIMPHALSLFGVISPKVLIF